VRVQLLGEIELASDRGNPHEFVSMVRDLAPGGDLTTQASYDFEFRNVELQHDSYRGLAVRLRYLLRVTVSRGIGQSVVKEFPLWVQNPSLEPPIVPVQGGEENLAVQQEHTSVTGSSSAAVPIKMEVGIEDCLHIEFEYNKGAFHLTDTVVGKIYFLLVRIKLKHMELEIRRRETTGGGAMARNESETLAKYEIMDGAPARGEAIPIRMSLAPYNLTPTYANVQNRFAVKYFLNLVLVDEEDRRYFKQQEVLLYRRGEEEIMNFAGEGNHMTAALPSSSSAPGGGNMLSNSSATTATITNTAAAAAPKQATPSSFHNEQRQQQQGQVLESPSAAVLTPGTAARTLSGESSHGDDPTANNNVDDEFGTEVPL
jgi:vacuolar protein sorting-associated protein 26